MRIQKSIWLVAILAVLVIISTGIGGYFLIKIPILSPSISISPTATLLPHVSVQKSYFSTKLGVRFNYMETDYQLGTDYSQKIGVKELGDKIYVYYANSKPTDGQWVQVMAKDKSDGLMEAIQKKFLTGYDPRKCYVGYLDLSTADYPSNLEFATINFPPTSDPDAPAWDNAKYCPQNYTTTNGISYFAYDKNFPDRFMYFSIGQYNISADENYVDGKSWQQTFQIFDPFHPTASVYTNSSFRLSVSLPISWNGYSATIQEWQGFINDETGEHLAVQGPGILIRHPLWSQNNPRQDVPILIFTIQQWQDLLQDKFHIGAAPIGPSELGRNAMFVFALPARYNYAYLPGWEEVEKIVNNKANFITN
jgi:hypothetical protein